MREGLKKLKNSKHLSKHLKCHLSPRVSHVTFLLKGHLWQPDITFLLKGHSWQPMSHVTFLLKGHSLQPVSHVTFLLKGQSEGRPGPSSTFSSLLSQKIAD